MEDLDTNAEAAEKLLEVLAQLQSAADARAALCVLSIDGEVDGDEDNSAEGFLRRAAVQGMAGS